ncbi:hypothetical protein DINM_000636 [Dirofilaria immitis]|nr:hypothetical protein [Dirofilaria immitis]
MSTTEAISSDSINPTTTLSSQSTGNLLMLLNTLYTPIFTPHTPNLPLLNGRTMHALYAISFIIYSITDICDWLFTWLAVALVSATVFGSMLTSLLLAFNNFRIAFLFMMLHDMPLTIINFIFITSCRCAGPHILQWPLVISSLATTISIIWRLVMLYFAYRRMIFPLKSTTRNNIINRQPTLYEQFKINLSQKNGGRLNDYDELWPVRYSVQKIYGPFPEDNHEQQTLSVKLVKSPYHIALYKLRLSLTPILKIILTTLLTLIIYILSILSCCAPCCYHYICSPRSFYHRHKCSSSFVRFFSQGFHWTIFITSLISTTILFTLNIIILSSVHGLGNNQITFEISHICIAVSPTQKTIQASIETNYKEHLSTSEIGYTCKPIWEEGAFRFGFNRQEAGTWQTRITLNGKWILAISTKIMMEYESDRQNPHHTLYYDYVLLQDKNSLSQSYTCIPGNKTDW